jgi:hypothetical protein
MALVVFAPCYLIALFVGRRWHFRRGLNAAIFWIAAWVIAVTARPVFGAISELFNPISRNV